MSEANLEIVASFPLPPKQFYEHLTEEEILKMTPPPIESEKLVIFGLDQVQELSNRLSEF